jgi:hypothetical protein
MFDAIKYKAKLKSELLDHELYGNTQVLVTGYILKPRKDYHLKYMIFNPEPGLRFLRPGRFWVIKGFATKSKIV